MTDVDSFRLCGSEEEYNFKALPGADARRHLSNVHGVSGGMLRMPSAPAEEPRKQ